MPTCNFDEGIFGKRLLTNQVAVVSGGAEVTRAYRFMILSRAVRGGSGVIGPTLHNYSSEVPCALCTPNVLFIKTNQEIAKNSIRMQLHAAFSLHYPRTALSLQPTIVHNIHIGISEVKFCTSRHLVFRGITSTT
ncbi:hypothetical protein EVAR_45259_1 [Eumeta japonica]|uniref:Uncharacterized protein n=1 Tax=Eumeta variegata TaxID=151549 RepID=A0A4C1XDR0_EUMVA|nr:hypothetical protein EVAR_45259_1 [Eumeta japonica]